MRQTLFILSTVFSLGLLFNSCKKYPENNLWFNHPGVILGSRDYDRPWLLEYYSVNNIDSTNQDFLKAYKEMGLYMLAGNKKSIEYKCPEIIGGFIRFHDHKEKYIEFRHASWNYNPNGHGYSSQRNIFLNPNIVWKIQKINKSAFWVIGEFNNLKYEIHFK